MINEVLNYLKSGVDDYLTLKKMVPEGDINEVLQLAVTLAQAGLQREHVERIIRFTEGYEAIRIAMDLNKIADRLEALGNLR